MVGQGGLKYVWVVKIMVRFSIYIINSYRKRIKKNMFRFFTSPEYRRLSGELRELDLLSDDLPIKLNEYQQYLRHKVIIEPSLNKQLEVLIQQKLTPAKFVKILAFLHTYLQTTCILQQSEQVLSFINHLYKEINSLADKTKKLRQQSESKAHRNTADPSRLRYQQLQWSKQLFLMEEIGRPYLYYLQKLISVFDFYNSLKKNFIKPMNQSEIWVLVNMFHLIEKIINNVPPICKFIRKSYRPVAEALAISFAQDVSNFYPKLYKYCYGEAHKVRMTFLEIENEQGEFVAFKKCAEGIDSMANLLVEIGQINRSLGAMYEEPTIHNLENIYVPKIIDTEGSDFDFIAHLSKMKEEQVLQKLKENYLERLTTPKFSAIQARTPEVRSEGQIDSRQKEGEGQANIFRDITNQDESIVTFRKEQFLFKGGALKKSLKQSLEEEPKIANSYQIQIQ